MTDIVEHLRDLKLHDAADEIERLRSLLQNGSPVVEGTIQHMAMELTACKADAERYRFFKAEHETHGGSMYAVWENGADDLDAAIDAAMKKEGE